ncbi:hypothetical protein PGRAT_25255 [Paenibacillus graminis]|uniref:Uncharacterized protein n=1 Tax=Paenibacillus graminis TaxID=189425 RepID=A0A089MBA2_9BACL|nr:hypothetical protein PGRAT_25255 [Paenibacillus graminis]
MPSGTASPELILGLCWPAGKRNSSALEFCKEEERKEILELEQRSDRLKAFRRKARIGSIHYARISTA